MKDKIKAFMVWFYYTWEAFMNLKYNPSVIKKRGKNKNICQWDLEKEA